MTKIDRPSEGEEAADGRGSPLAGLVLFVGLLVGLFVATGHVVTEASGKNPSSGPVAGVSVKTGEAVFWGRGRCHTCHSVGSRGSAVRGPNLGQSRLGPPIGARARERARERRRQGAAEMDRTDYLVESLVAPGDYVVEGFSDEMPEAHRPPLSLSGPDIEAVILYLQSLGGEPAPDDIRLPREVRRRAPGGAGPDTLVMLRTGAPGDSGRGRHLFFDRDGPAACSRCHVVDGEGGGVGPDLTGIASVRRGDYVLESILRPAQSIANGFASTVVRTTDGRLLDGLVTNESADSVWIADSRGRIEAIPRSRIDAMKEQEVSIMPENFDQLLTVRQLTDLLAFLLSLR